MKDMEKYREQGMPWIEKASTRVQEQQRLSGEAWITTLVYISCVGLIQANTVVNMEKLEALQKQLPLSMTRMQEKLLLSKFKLPQGTKIPLYQLHDSIPTRIPAQSTPTAAASPAEAKRGRQEQDEETLRPEEVQTKIEPLQPAFVEKGGMRHYPPNMKIKWSAEELAVIPTQLDKSHLEAYYMYIKSVQELGVPVRHFMAFVGQRERLLLSS